MGGIGSGRRYKTDKVKPVVESSICLDLTDLRKKGAFQSGRHSEIMYSIGSQQILSISVNCKESCIELCFLYKGRQMCQKIELASIICFNFYSRQYLICPECCSSRNQLYLGENGRFSCRLCNGLNYKVQKMNPHLRLAYNAEKLRKNKLNPKEPGRLSAFSRPKFMRQKKYYKIMNRIIAYEKKSHELFMKYFCRLNEVATPDFSEPNVLKKK